MSNERLPINLPFYWSVIKQAYSDEAAFVDSANILLNDVLQAVIAELESLDPRTASTKNYSGVRLGRISTLSNYPSVIDDRDTEFLLNNGVLVKHYELVSGAYHWLGKYKRSAQGVVSTAKIADTFYNPTVSFQQDVDYTIDDDYFIFNEDVVAKVAYTESATLVAPSGKSYDIKTAVFIFFNTETGNGPLYRDFGCLVYNKDITSNELELAYRKKIVGLLLVNYKGSTFSALNAAINALFSLPITLYDGEVVSSIERVGSHVIVTTSNDRYTLDATIPLNEDLLIPGKRLPIYTPFHTVVSIDTTGEPTAIPEKLYRVNPYAGDSPASISDLYTPALDSNKVLASLLYDNLQVYDGVASSSADINNLLTQPFGHFRLVDPSLPILHYNYSIASGGGSDTFVGGDLLFKSVDGRVGRFRNLIYKGETATAPTDRQRGEYHVYKATSPINYTDFLGNPAVIAAGEYFVCDTFSQQLFKLTDIDVTIPIPFTYARAITFDFFSQISINREKTTSIAPYKVRLVSDAYYTSSFNRYIWDDLIRSSYFRVRITIPNGHVLFSDLSFLDDIIPVWALYNLDVVVKLSDTISTSNIADLAIVST